MRLVIQTAFENVRAFLVFQNGFPDAIEGIEYVKSALIAAGRYHQPKSCSILQRLVSDEAYMEKMTRLVSRRFCIGDSD
jgi:hypothetical protein